MPVRVLPAWEQPVMRLQILRRAPDGDDFTRLPGDFELDSVALLALEHFRVDAEFSACAHVGDPQRDQIAASQLAVDRQIEECKIAALLSNLEANPNGPHVLRFQRCFPVGWGTVS